MSKPESAPGRTSRQVQRGFRSIDPYNRPPYDSYRTKSGMAELMARNTRTPSPSVEACPQPLDKPATL